MTLSQRFDSILSWFAENMPVAESELHFRNPYECIVAVMLSAQCTDRRVNLVTPALFAAYPTVASLAAASATEVYPYIRSISYPNAKAEHLVGMAQQVMSLHDGQIPDTTELLTALPGVGRKTANVVQAVIWGKPTMAVDTHIFRVSARLGLTRNSRTPFQTEQVLTRHIPSDLIPRAHHWFLLHGRYVCTARSPQCDRCGLAPYCASYAQKHKSEKVNSSL